jgi:hypothetical protein
MFEHYYMMLTFVAYTLIQILILPFIRLYMGDVTDAEYADRYIPVLFTMLNLFFSARGLSYFAISFAQHFKQTRIHAILEAGINVVVTIATVFRFGIYGALIGTIAALVYRAIAMTIYSNRIVLHRSPWITFRRWLIYIAVFALMVFASAKIMPQQFYSYWEALAWAVPSGCAVLLVFLCTAVLSEPHTAKYFLRFLKERKLSSGKGLIKL